MIIRVFRAKVRKGRVTEFKQMVKDQSIPWLESTEGMLGYFPGEPLDDRAREFMMITLWRDSAALEAFAGTDWENNPVVTEDEAPLVEAMFADHYLRFGKD